MVNWLVGLLSAAVFVLTIFRFAGIVKAGPLPGWKKAAIFLLLFASFALAGAFLGTAING